MRMHVNRRDYLVQRFFQELLFLIFLIDKNPCNLIRALIFQDTRNIGHSIRQLASAILIMPCPYFLRRSPFNEISNGFRNTELFAYHRVKGKLAEVLGRDEAELAVVVAGSTVVQLIMVLLD